VEREKTASDEREQKQLTCPECACVFAGVRLCPECGYFFAPKGKEVRTLEGELVEIGMHLDREQQDQLGFFCELRGVAVERGYKPGWAAHKFKEKFGDWPSRTWNSSPVLKPSEETRRWVKGMAIRYIKSRQQLPALPRLPPHMQGPQPWDDGAPPPWDGMR
jgi:DNA repair protein RadD